MLAWMKAGRTQCEVADRLNAEGRTNAEGRPWCRSLVSQVMRRYLDAPTHAALSAAGLRRGPAAVRKKVAESNAAVLPRIVEMSRAGIGQRQIAANLNDEGLRNSRGRPWTQAGVSAVLRRHVETREYDGLVDARAGAKRRHNEAILPRIVELIAAGLSQRQVADRLNAEGRVNSRGWSWNQGHVSDLLIRYHDGAALGKPPVIPGEPGQPVQVLGLDGQYRVKSLGGAAQSKARWKVVKALIDAGLEGLSGAHLRAKVTGGALSVITTLMEDPDWAAIIYPPEKGKRIGWRFGPPRRISA
jgi:hypothetical protein